MGIKLFFCFLLVTILTVPFGCVNNSEEDLYGLECDTLNMTYNKVKYIFEDNCFVCHNVPQGPNLIKFNSYSEVKDIINTGKLWPAINHTGTINMPKDQAKLDDCQIDKIGAWINAGMPQ